MATNSINASVVRDGNFDYLQTDTLDVRGDARIKNLAVSGPANFSALTVGSLQYPTSAPAKGFLISTGSQITSLSRLFADTQGAIAQNANDHIKFRAPLLQIGTNITVDVTSAYSTALNVPSLGRITVQPGTYQMSAGVLEYGVNAANGVLIAALRNADTGDFFSFVGAGPAAGTDRYLVSDNYVATFTIPTRIDFTFAIATTLESYGKAYIDIQQLA